MISRWFTNWSNCFSGKQSAIQCMNIYCMVWHLTCLENRHSALTCLEKYPISPVFCRIQSFLQQRRLSLGQKSVCFCHIAQRVTSCCQSIVQKLFFYLVNWWLCGKKKQKRKAQKISGGENDEVLILSKTSSLKPGNGRKLYLETSTASCWIRSVIYVCA